MSTLTDSPEYKALTDSLDRLAERGLFCALVALFRSLFALLAAIKSGAVLLPSPPVIEPRRLSRSREPGSSRSDSDRAETKGMDGRGKRDHDTRGATLEADGRDRRDHDAHGVMPGVNGRDWRDHDTRGATRDADGRDRDDHDAHGVDGRVLRPFVGVGPQGMDGRDERDHDADWRVRRPPVRGRAVHQRAQAPARRAGARVCFRGPIGEFDESHAMPLASWVTLDVRCFRNGLRTNPDTYVFFVTITD